MPHTASTVWNNFQPSSSIFAGSVLPPLSFLAVSSFLLFLRLTQRKAHTSSLPAHLLTHVLAEVSSLIPSQPPHPLLNNQSSNYGTRGKELEETFALSPLSMTIREKKSRLVGGKRSPVWVSVIQYPLISDSISKSHISSTLNFQAPFSWARNTAQTA